jgi:hypothetical protein
MTLEDWLNLCVFHDPTPPLLSPHPTKCTPKDMSKVVHSYRAQNNPKWEKLKGATKVKWAFGFGTIKENVTDQPCTQSPRGLLQIFHGA